MAREQIGRRRLHVHALLHALEVAAALPVENDDFAIQQARRALMRRGSEANSGYCEVTLCRRASTDELAIGDPSERAGAIPLISKSQAGSERGARSAWRAWARARGHGRLSRSTEFRGPEGRAALRRQFSAISSSVRPVRTEPSCPSIFQAGSAAPSWCLIMSHSFFFSPRLVDQNKTAAQLFPL